MTLRTKALIAVAISLVASAALIYGVSDRILVREVLAIESDQMTREVSVLRKAIEREQTELDARAFDYAVWDDTYDFMEDPSPDYIRANLPDNVYESLELNLLAFVRPDGTLIYGRSFDLENGISANLPDALKNLCRSGSPLFESGRAGTPAAGIVNTAEGTFIVASRPILRSDEQGPPRGALLVGRLLTPSFIAALGDRTQLNTVFAPLDGRDVAPDVLASLPTLTGPSSVAVATLNSETIAGYTRLDDIYGQPALVLKVESPRLIYQQGTQAVAKYVLVVLGIIIAIGVALNLALSGWVLAPLRKVLTQVKDLAVEQTHAGRLVIPNGVEFGALGREINSLLDELEAAQQEVSHLYGLAREQAEHDALTGLLSRRFIVERLEAAVSMAQSHKGKLALMMIDVDGFKLFNDAHGHPAGDSILETVSKALSASTRDGDLVGRYGGDEFLVVLPNTDTKGAVSQAERLLHAVDELTWRTPGGIRVPISLSIGVSAYPRHGSDLNELIAYADANLYAAKQKGGHTVSSAISSGEDGVVDHGFGVLDSLITAISEKDHYTRRHSEEVASHAVHMAEALGLSDRMIRAIRMAGLLHDVGKTGIPASLLLRPGPLTAEEDSLVRRHVEIGLALIRDVPELEAVLEAVGAHHERMDGSGYPRGLQGRDIPLAGRVLAIADTYSAMTTRRPHHRAKTSEEACEEIRKVAGSQLDPRVVEVFLSLFDPTPNVAEKSGEVGTRDVPGVTTKPVGWTPETGVA
jgi:diguanylate cyclase (GGDEF)-like protein/putative nucleotidyltransferase with HDIG domain